MTSKFHPLSQQQTFRKEAQQNVSRKEKASRKDDQQGKAVAMGSAATATKRNGFVDRAMLQRTGQQRKEKYTFLHVLRFVLRVASARVRQCKGKCVYLLLLLEGKSRKTSSQALCVAACTPRPRKSTASDLLFRCGSKTPSQANVGVYVNRETSQFDPLQEGNID